MRARVNLPGTVGKWPSQVASGPRSSAASCEALGREKHFPATEEDVLLYAGIFSCGQTLGDYTRYLKLAHELLDKDIDFDAPRLRAACKGAKKTWQPV